MNVRGTKKTKITVVHRDRDILTAPLQLRYWEATVHYLVSRYVSVGYLWFSESCAVGFSGYSYIVNSLRSRKLRVKLGYEIIIVQS
jgi:hypothetical protein